MSDMFEESAGDVEMNNCEIAFDNLVIMKELGNIVNLVRNEDFLDTVPKSKLRRVKWLPLFNHLKQEILDEMIQELSSMWEFENLPEKLNQLEQQKEKFGEVNEDQTLWRPQLGDVKAQLKATDVANLHKQKALLESHAKEYERRVNRHEKILSAKRGYIKALQMDLQQYQKKNEEFFTQFIERFENHKNTVYVDKVDVEELCWATKDWIEMK